MSESGETSSKTMVRATENIGENNVESETSCSSPATEIPRNSDVHVSLTNLPDIQATVNRELPSFPRQAQRGIPVNEFRKVQQKPHRVLPCLPPIVLEILQWTIHPEKVLRGAASVSHLFSLPTINEEVLPISQLIEEKGLPTVHKEKLTVSNVTLTNNQALSSNKPSVVSKPLPKFRVEFRKRMQPSLPTIEERRCPLLPEKERSCDPSLEFIEHHLWKHKALKNDKGSGVKRLRIKKSKNKQPKLKQKVRENNAKPEKKEEMANVIFMTEKTLQNLETLQTEVNRSRPSLSPAGTNEWLYNKSNEVDEMPHLRATLARRSKTLFQPPKEKRKACLPSLKAVLPNTPSIKETMIPRPPSTPKGQRGALPVGTRKCSTLIRPLNNILTTHKEVVPIPLSTPKRHPGKQTQMINCPLQSISLAQNSLVPKPPSTPKEITSRHPVSRRFRLNKSKKLPGIQKQAEEQTLLDQQSLVKFPLSSVHLDHPAASRVQRTMDSNFQPLEKDTKQNGQRNMANDEGQEHNLI